MKNKIKLKIMNEKHFCRCCLAEECYKDMANNYYIGNKTENYFEMFLNIFSINISSKDAQRCLICEDCVSKLRDAAAFKKQVLNIQETIKKKLCWINNGVDIDTNIDPKIEHNDEDFDDFYDDLSDNFSESDFVWDNYTHSGSQNEQVFVIKLNKTEAVTQNLSKTTISKINGKRKLNKTEPDQDESTNKNTSPSKKRRAGTYSTKKHGNTENTNTIDKNTNSIRPKRNSNTKDSNTDTQRVNLDTVDTNTDDNVQNPETIASKTDGITKTTRFDTNSEISAKNTNNTATKKNNTRESSDFDINSNDESTEMFNTYDSEDDSDNSGGTKRTAATRELKKVVTAKQNNEKRKRKKPKRQELSQSQLHSKHIRENTIKLILNSNLCLFRSFQNKYGCNFCKTRFPEFSQLREHSLTHSNPKTLAHRVNKFKLCGLSCKNAEISDLKCNICSENCIDLTELTKHLKVEHEISFHGTDNLLVPYKLQDGFSCLLCDSRFNSYLRLSIHMNTHFKYNVCEICGMSFINRLSLRAHVHTMHTEKKCSHCPAIFLTHAAKVKHLRQVHKIHNSKRHCILCNETFRYTYMLVEHKIQKHGAKRQICSCSECGKTFFSPNNLKIHVRSVHIKERNFPCSKCGRSFFTKCDQKRHERTHEDVRSFSCSYCEAKFKSKDSWRRHLKRQHGHEFGETS